MLGKRIADADLEGRALAGARRYDVQVLLRIVPVGRRRTDWSSGVVVAAYHGQQACMIRQRNRGALEFLCRDDDLARRLNELLPRIQKDDPVSAELHDARESWAGQRPEQ